MATVLAANLALRFLLELCALAALGYWGFQTGGGPLLKTTLGLGTPLLAALVWGSFVAPKAAVPVSEPLRLVLELIVFGSATIALAAAGHPGLSWALGLAVVVNRIAIVAWGQ